MTPYETIVMTAKPHANGYAADLRPKDMPWRRPSVRAWWDRHPATGDKPPVVWPVKTEV
ncbi:hypothetical protein [Azospirillum sp. TSA6c]|uniref:hypothetical protein n=1 Tax=Azospirillum sp. TSA6c TaxID=709813 RepID=UPI0013050557|nr:hypothetical protein [Azospirillum sp. TSA6c]